MYFSPLLVGYPLVKHRVRYLVRPDLKLPGGRERVTNATEDDLLGCAVCSVEAHRISLLKLTVRRYTCVSVKARDIISNQALGF